MGWRFAAAAALAVEHNVVNFVSSMCLCLCFGGAWRDFGGILLMM